MGLTRINFLPLCFIAPCSHLPGGVELIIGSGVSLRLAWKLPGVKDHVFLPVFHKMKVLIEEK